jgi:hypothetical protein
MHTIYLTLTRVIVAYFSYLRQKRTLYKFIQINFLRVSHKITTELDSTHSMHYSFNYNKQRTNAHKDFESQITQDNSYIFRSRGAIFREFKYKGLESQIQKSWYHNYKTLKYKTRSC